MTAVEIQQRVHRLYAINMMREKAGKERIKLSDILYISWSGVEQIT